jgi:hypothetical protein
MSGAARGIQYSKAVIGAPSFLLGRARLPRDDARDFWGRQC